MEGDTLGKEMPWQGRYTREEDTLVGRNSGEEDRRYSVEGNAMGREIHWGGTCPEREIPVSGKSAFWERVLSEILFRRKTI